MDAKGVLVKCVHRLLEEKPVDAVAALLRYLEEEKKKRDILNSVNSMRNSQLAASLSSIRNSNIDVQDGDNGKSTSIYNDKDGDERAKIDQLARQRKTDAELPILKTVNTNVQAGFLKLCPPPKSYAKSQKVYCVLRDMKLSLYAKDGVEMLEDVAFEVKTEAILVIDLDQSAACLLDTDRSGRLIQIDGDGGKAMLKAKHRKERDLWFELLSSHPDDRQSVVAAFK